MITTIVLPEHRPHLGIGMHDYARRAAAWVRESCCGLHGHDLMVHFDRGRICLKCPFCGHETSGWQIQSRSKPS
jgi:hypothetical protein